MSIQWTFIAGYLYCEIALVILLISPIFSPRRWYRIFHSRLFALFYERAAIYFYVFLGVLSLFLIDAIREIKKYSHPGDAIHVNLGSELKGNVKLFRAQRNFYITGFAVFLAFVIKRLVTMIIIEHELETKADQIIRKAENTVKLAKTTILANNLQNISDDNENANKLVEKESLLEKQKIRVKELEEEATKWRLKYEEVLINNKSSGHGDE